MTRDRVARALLFSVLLVALAPGSARAHGRSVSYSSWDLETQEARVRVRIPLLELTRLPQFGASVVRGDPRVGEYLARHLRLRTPQGPCPISQAPAALESPTGWTTHEWRVACPGGAPRSIESDILLAVAPSHLHFTRVRESGTVREHVLSSGEPSWLLGPDAPSAAPRGSSIPSYVMLGIEHIASGVDHLAFLLALILLAASLREVGTLVTGFTIAHSVTLALAALGLLRPDPAAVEALIGFSVALVAAENAWLLGGRGWVVPASIALGLGILACLAALGVGGLTWLTFLGLALFSWCHFGLLDRVSQPARLRAGISFAFGLVHGFGFAGVLSELELPRERLVPALFGFNVGVELGQLAIVALMWPTLRLLGRLREGRVEGALAEAGSALVCGLGIFWFLSRTFP